MSTSRQLVRKTDFGREDLAGVLGIGNGNVACFGIVWRY